MRKLRLREINWQDQNNTRGMLKKLDLNSYCWCHVNASYHMTSQLTHKLGSGQVEFVPLGRSPKLHRGPQAFPGLGTLVWMRGSGRPADLLGNLQSGSPEPLWTLRQASSWVLGTRLVWDLGDWGVSLSGSQLPWTEFASGTEHVQRLERRAEQEGRSAHSCFDLIWSNPQKCSTRATALKPDLLRRRVDRHLSIHQSHWLPERVSPTTLQPAPLPLQCVQASSRVIYYLPLTGRRPLACLPAWGLA